MIERIEVQNIASFDSSPEMLSDLSKNNFIYGANGSGKTTLSRLIDNESHFPECQVIWKGGAKMQALVYNRDYVKRNFEQPPELKGIFTLGEDGIDTQDQINIKKEEVNLLLTAIQKLKDTLEGTDDNDGKRAELDKLEKKIEEKCWSFKKKYDEKFQEAFSGVRDKKNKFKERLLKEYQENRSTLKSIDDLEKKAGTVFAKQHQIEEPIPDFNIDTIIQLESDKILEKRVIGKTDVDIAAMIEKLGSSDWVDEGRPYYEENDGICPFCQQKTPPSFEKSLNEYFDETFKRDIEVIESLKTNYETNSERLQMTLENITNAPSKFLDLEKLKLEKQVLDSKININQQRIEKKKKESSLRIELDSLKNVLTEIKKLIDTANESIKNHNGMVKNIGEEKENLRGEVWKFILEEIKSDLDSYLKQEGTLTMAIDNLNRQIGEKQRTKSQKETEIRELEKKRTSIQPTIDGINSILKSFDFTGFSLAKSETEGFYKIRRQDGSDAKDTLSEGEKTFLTFLYFYHHLKGSDTESGITTDRIVVFDDPVSSLDSDVLFIVSSLIKGLFEEIRQNNGNIKQIFVLTHNIYFHKEVAFNPKRSNGRALNEETFWMINKTGQYSKIQRCETNPIKTSYELLWMEIRNCNRSNLSIQNTLRRILEYYFKILGNIDSDTICDYFEGKDKLICKSLFSWINDGSHFANDDLYISVDNSTVDKYLSVFKDIFEKTEHMPHYRMMMGTSVDDENHTDVERMDS